VTSLAPVLAGTAVAGCSSRFGRSTEWRASDRDGGDCYAPGERASAPSATTDADDRNRRSFATGSTSANGFVAALPIDRAATVLKSEFDLLGDAERVIDLDAEVADGAFELRVPKQQPHCSQVAGLRVNLRLCGTVDRRSGRRISGAPAAASLPAPFD